MPTQIAADSGECPSHLYEGSVQFAETYVYAPVWVSAYPPQLLLLVPLTPPSSARPPDVRTGAADASGAPATDNTPAAASTPAAGTPIHRTCFMADTSSSFRRVGPRISLRTRLPDRRLYA